MEKAAAKWKDLKTERMPLTVDCLWSNIREEWITEAIHDETKAVIASGKGRTRPEALRELAEKLEELR